VGAPIVCNGGVTIAKEVDLKDPEENFGAQMLRQAAEKSGESVGDGTSMSPVLAHAILADGVRNVVAGANAIAIKRGLDRAAKAAIEALKILSRSVRERKEKAQAVAISAHKRKLRPIMVTLAERLKACDAESRRAVTHERSKLRPITYGSTSCMAGPFRSDMLPGPRLGSTQPFFSSSPGSQCRLLPAAVNPQLWTPSFSCSRSSCALYCTSLDMP
jgi:hypothetical protein